MNKIYLVIAMMFVSICAHSLEQTPDLGKRQAENAVKLFFLTCVPSEGDRRSLIKISDLLKMQRMDGPSTEQFIGTSAAVGWLQHKDSSSYILSSFGSGMCSVMSRYNDKEHLLSSFFDLLPKNEGGFKTEIINETRKNGATTVSYLVTEKSGRSFRFVVSANNNINVKLQGLITYEKIGL